MTSKTNLPSPTLAPVYLIRLWVGHVDVAPGLDDPTQIDRVHRDLDLPDVVVLGEPVKVKDLEDERLRSDVRVRHLPQLSFVQSIAIVYMISIHLKQRKMSYELLIFA